MRALRTSMLFDGIAMRGPATVLIENGRIAALLDAGAAPEGVAVETLDDGRMLAPGFIDLQVNGGGGVMFNDSCDADAIRIMAAAHARCGTTTILPTLISGTRAQIAAAVAAGRGTLGVHIEGPFISLARRGIHPAANVTTMTDADVEMLGSAALVTLAPECVGAVHIGALASRGVRVFAGHTDATAAETLAGLRAGIVGFTHLFNAMSQFGSRAPGAVGAALADRAAYAGIIADGLHVDPVSIAAAYAALGPDRMFLVSDAMATAGSDVTAFMLNAMTIRLCDGKLTDDAGTLAGAHLTIASAVRNAVSMMGIVAADALRMATATPAAALGARDRGRVAPGCRADFVCLDRTLRVEAVWIGGERL